MFNTNKYNLKIKKYADSYYVLCDSLCWKREDLQISIPKKIFITKIHFNLIVESIMNLMNLRAHNRSAILYFYMKTHGGIGYIREHLELYYSLMQDDIPPIKAILSIFLIILTSWIF